MIVPNESVPAVFLDRDGTLMEEVNYCSDPKQVKVFPGVPGALERMKARGYKLIVISNQAGIGRGYFTEEQYRAVEAELARAILPATLDATYFCPDHPDRPTNRRKPAPGMVLEAQRDHRIDLARSFFIGDKAIDIECGRNAGVRTILVKTGYGANEHAQSGANWIAEDLREAAAIVLRESDPVA
ncbi:MAG: HAD family hydrolase [Chthoniobacterales bacterium]|nr:HAD family hydrolase [Chthoniobacterales bacterium]